MTDAERDPARQAAEPEEPRELLAYYRGARPRMRIVPASRWRTWMNETYKRNANGCLPLLVANEAGWVLLNERRFTATWSGGDRPQDLEIRYEGVRPTGSAMTIFGYGILSFAIPYLFRTPLGWDLLARGPANEPRDGIAALEGLVETDWAYSPFTMNWKFTRPGEVVFEADEAVCMVVPQRRHDLTSFRPDVRAADEAADGTGAAWEAALRSRQDVQVRKFLAEYSREHSAARMEWEAHYFRGRTVDGVPAPEHVTKRRLGTFPGMGDDQAATGPDAT